MAGGFNGLGAPDSSPDLRWYLGVLWRRKLAILPLLIVLPLATYLRLEPPPPSYEASATVLLNRQSAGLSGISDPAVWDPSRTIRTQSELARVPEIAQRVAQEARLGGLDAASFLSRSSVGFSDDEDLMSFYARWGEPDAAVRLANLYAQKYIEFRQELDTKALRESIRLVSEQIEELRSQGIGVQSSAYQSLLGRQQQLQSAQALQESNALLVRPATGAGQVADQGYRTVFIALGIGLILGLGLAFLFESLDTRVRSLDVLRDQLDLPLLAAVPARSRPWRRDRRPVMLREPESPAAEPFRMLRAALQVSMRAGSGVVMVSSAREGEGKSTTAANLAIAMARAGQHVMLVDLDLYRPGLQRLFELSPGPGMSEVAEGKAELEGVVRSLPLRPAGFARSSITESAVSANGRAGKGRLELVTAGLHLEAPGEFLASRGFDVVLERMRHRADVVIVDGPPILLSSDGLVLASKVDSLLLVARLNLVKQEEIHELAQVLAGVAALKLGLVVTGASRGGASYYYGYRTRQPSGTGDRVL